MCPLERGEAPASLAVPADERVRLKPQPRARLLVPGLVPRDPGRETYRVRPGGTTTVSLHPDDRLTIRDVHGGQRAEIVGLAGHDALVELFGPTSLPGVDRDVHGRPRRRRAGRCSRGCACRRGWHPRLRPSARDLPRDTDGRRRRARPPRPARRSSPRLPGRPRLRARLRGEGGRVHPGDRRARTPVLRLPRLQRPQAPGRQGTWPRRDCDPVADGQRLSRARAPLQVLRPRPRAAGRGRPRHGRPPRHLRPRLHGQVLRGHGLLRPRQLLRQLQRGARAVHDRAAQGLARDQLLLQHRFRRAQPVPRRRAVVATG